MDNQEQAYGDALKNELIQKRRLLAQARGAYEELKSSIEESSLDSSAWKQLAQRQLYVSNRSDPIGIASIKQSLTIDSRQGLFEEGTVHLKELVKSQTQFNSDLKTLYDLLKDRLRHNDFDIQPSNKAGNGKLQKKLDYLVRNYLALDICSEASFSSGGSYRENWLSTQ